MRYILKNVQRVDIERIISPYKTGSKEDHGDVRSRFSVVTLAKRSQSLILLPTAGLRSAHTYKSAHPYMGMECLGLFD